MRYETWMKRIIILGTGQVHHLFVVPPMLRHRHHQPTYIHSKHSPLYGLILSSLKVILGHRHDRLICLCMGKQEHQGKWFLITSH